MGGIWRDILFSFRLVGKARGFTALAVTCLGLGIGVSTAIFSLINYVYLRPLPVSQANDVVVVSRGGEPMFSWPDYRDLRDRSHSLAAVAASTPTESSIDYQGNSTAAGAEAVTANYAKAIGAPLALGRWFRTDDEPSAVISYKTWQRVFGEDPDVLGKQVRSENRWYTVIGVAGKEFAGTYLPIGIDIWVPFGAWAKQYPNIELETRDRRHVMIFARLNPGFEPSQAAAELNAIASNLPRSGETAPIFVERARGTPNPNTRRKAAPIVILLLAVAGLILLIACVNVGNLLLARGAARQREIGIRLALGAARRRIVRQLFTENLALGLCGGCAGILIGYALSRAIEASVPMTPFGEILSIHLRIDPRVLGFTACAALASTLLFGTGPAWRAGRPDGRFQLRNIAVIAQVSLSLFLLLTAGLFVRVLLRMHTIDPGFQVDHRLFANTLVSPPEFSPESGRRFYLDLESRLLQLPGVRSVGLTSYLPLLPIPTDCAASAGGQNVRSTSVSIGSGFLQTMSIPLLAGRDFTANEPRDNVAIVNEALASQLWPNQPAVGQTLRYGCKHPVELEVVGVARNSQTRSLGGPAEPHIYSPFTRDYGGMMAVVVATGPDADAVLETVRSAISSANPNVRIYGVRTLSEFVDRSYWQVRWESSLLAVIGLLALVLAVAGLYGVIAHFVSRRTRDIGVRVAVGARPADIRIFVLRRGMALALPGLAIGIGLALASGRALSGLLLGVSPADFPTYATVVLMWTAVSVAAFLIPANRAAAADPVDALRHE
jgi:predicted permease